MQASEPGKVFLVGVGAKHFAGPDSVLSMLEAQGFVVRERLLTPNSRCFDALN